MWTPKRVLLLVAGFAFCFGAYQIYAFFFGGIDGLPPLPAIYARLANFDSAGVEFAPRANKTNERLGLAFGADPNIFSCPIKLDLRSRNLALAAERFDILPDGRVKLTYFNLAIFSKQQPEGQLPEINTIRSREAYITFDKPVENPNEMSNRKIEVTELVGKVEIVNNRGTQARDDDLYVFTPGPVWYEEKLNRIYTNAVVEINDSKSKPEPATITATGMDIHLTSEPNPAPAAKAGSVAKATPAKGKNDRISGVEFIKLRQDVEMHLWMDPNSGFLSAAKPTTATGNGKTAAANAAAPRPSGQGGNDAPPGAQPAKAKVVIKTLGPFVYDVSQERAQFDILQRPNLSAPDRVRVHRINEPTKWDQMECDRLVLQFRRKKATDAANASVADSSPEVLEIENAVATALAGNHVIVASDKETLDAFGAELTYDARTKLSILRGNASTPKVSAIKDGNEIFAREIWLGGATGKGAQQATAKGPGEVHMLDRATGKRNLEARWTNELLFGKDGEQDLLTLTGNAAFEDTEHAQLLQADRLKVWLQPADQAPESGQQKRLPQRIEANGQVRTHSAELVVHDTDSLFIFFDDTAPAAGPPGKTQGETATIGTEASAGNRSPVTLATPTASVSSQAAPAGREPAKVKKPIDLQARSVRVRVRRSAGRNELDQIWCEGGVQVHQDPETDKDKGVDIRGQTLNLKHLAEGNQLVVTGQSDRLAFVQFDKLVIQGPQVYIDQIANQARVDGLGSLRMPSDKNLEGQPLAQPKDLTIHWNQRMFFNGRDAQFLGGVQTDQDNVRMLCQDLTVLLDRTVSLRSGEKSDKPARVDKLVCDKQVRVEDTTRDGQRLLRYQRIEAKELSMDNEAGQVVAPGPGVVTLLQLGAKDDFLPANPAAPKAPPNSKPAAPVRSSAKPEEEIKLTRVYYGTTMRADNTNRVAKFYGGVEVIHLPSDNPDIVVDLKKRLPPGCFTMRCDRLEVSSTKQNEGKSQDMRAYDHVTLEAQDYWGRADEVKYNEQTDLIIFEGKNGNQAELYQVVTPGSPPKVTRADKIKYWRRTNEVSIENGRGISIHK